MVRWYTHEEIKEKTERKIHVAKAAEFGVGGGTEFSINQTYVVYPSALRTQFQHRRQPQPDDGARNEHGAKKRAQVVEHGQPEQQGGPEAGNSVSSFRFMLTGAVSEGVSERDYL